MVNPNEDTEFNDALRAHGILPPKPPSRSPSPDIPHLSKSDITQTIAATATTAQLGELLENEQLDSDDEAMFQEYRAKRLEQMRKEEKRGRFGALMPLGREDFVREVTEGSKARLPGDEDEEVDALDDDDEEEEEGRRKLDKGKGKLKGTGVVVFLYKDSIPLSQHLRPLLARLAELHPSTKFLAIRADLCIPNYPDRNVPTLLIYRNGDITGNVVAGMGLNGMKTTIQDLQSLLLRYQALEKPSPALRSSARNGEDSDGDDVEDGVGTVNAKKGGLRTGARGVADDSDESDFDL